MDHRSILKDVSMQRPLQFCSEPSKPGHQVIKSSALEVCEIHTENFEPSSPSNWRHDLFHLKGYKTAWMKQCFQVAPGPFSILEQYKSDASSNIK